MWGGGGCNTQSRWPLDDVMKRSNGTANTATEYVSRLVAADRLTLTVGALTGLAEPSCPTTTAAALEAVSFLTSEAALRFCMTSCIVPTKVS